MSNNGSAGMSTHRDLSRALSAIADRLEKVPPGYLVSDGGTLDCIRSAASILVDQDRRLGELTVQVRELRYGK